jgi:hypothetical protein
MLAAEGYRVLHSTRHCLLEFGKDILAVGPDGVGCAFQLKGDPGGRMTVGEFRREIQPQLVQLMGQSPSYPGFPTGAHRSYLVSNGQFEEEVQAAVREMNLAPYPSKATLWSRGDMLAMCKKHSELLWPKELSDSRSLLELYMLNPRGMFPVERFDELLSSILGMGDEVKAFGRPEAVRTASSATWVTGLAVSGFAEASNHASVALAWAQCCVALIGAADKHLDGDLGPIQSSFDLAESALLDSLSALWEEVRERKTLVEGDPLADRDIVGWRVTTVVGLMTCLALAQRAKPLLTASSDAALKAWLAAPRRIDVWGEAAAGALLPWCVWLRSADATSRPDHQIKTFAAYFVAANQHDTAAPLASPYYLGEEALGMRLSLPKHMIGLRETFAGNAYMVVPALHLLVRTGLKQACKRLWPEVTRIGHRGILLREASDFCRFKVRRGIEVTKMFPHTYAWSDLKRDALHGDGSTKVPVALAGMPWLLAAWWQVAPHRLDANSMRLFVDGVVPGWGT